MGWGDARSPRAEPISQVLHGSDEVVRLSPGGLGHGGSQGPSLLQVVGDRVGIRQHPDFSKLIDHGTFGPVLRGTWYHRLRTLVV